MAPSDLQANDMQSLSDEIHGDVVLTVDCSRQIRVGEVELERPRNQQEIACVNEQAIQDYECKVNF